MMYYNKVTIKEFEGDKCVSKNSSMFNSDLNATWSERLMEYAKMLNTMPNNYKFYIDLNILEKHIYAAADEQLKKLVEENKG